MRLLPAAFLCLAALAALSCSDDGTEGPGISHGYDGAIDSGGGEVDTCGDTGAEDCAGGPKDAGHIADVGEPDAGGQDAGEPDAGRPAASIQVDTATVTNVSDRLINGSGLEVENNAQGLGAEMLTDRGFEWDRAWLSQKGWETWWFFQEAGVQAKVEWVTDHVYQGSHAFKFTMTQMQTDKSAGIAQGGLGVVKDRAYTFSFWIYHEGGESQFVHAALIDVPDPNDPSKDKILAGPNPVTVNAAAGRWANHTIELRPGESAKTAAVALLVPYPSEMWFDALSLTPKDAQNGVWRELVAAFKDARISTVRLGGISADGYDWGMGIGARDRRGVYRSAFADTVIDPSHEARFMPVYNDVGTDEFLDFCKAIDAEPLITVNFPLGAQAAANWVEYANGASPGLQKGIDNGWKPESYKSADKAPAGYFAWLREFNGVERGVHAAPWGVKYWEIGNELWDEELPEPGSLKGQANLSNYAVKAREFAVAMKAVDPSIKVGACTSQLPLPAPPDYRADWNKKVLEVAGDQLDFLAPHFYAPGDFDYAAAPSPETAFYQIAGTGPYYAQEIGKVQSAIDLWRQGGGGRDIKIAATEYNVWHGVFKYTNKFDVNRLRSVIANATFRNHHVRGPVWMGNFYSLVNHPFGMLDWDADAKSTGAPLLGGNYLLQKFLQDHFAPNAHAVSVQAPSYAAHLWTLDPIESPLLDVTAAGSDDGRTLVILAVNRAYWHPEGLRTVIDLGQFSGTSAKAYILTGVAQDAYNQTDARGNIYIEEETVPQSGTTLDYTFKQYSVTALEIKK